MKLLHRLYQVCAPSLTHQFDANAYLLDTDEGLYLIDCGTPKGYARCLQNIRALGYDPSSIKAIFGTHGHYDHVGSAYRFFEDFGTVLYLHGADRLQVESGDSQKTTASLLYGTEFTPCKVSHELTDKQVFDFHSHKLEIIHTPGHSPGSICISIHTHDLKVLIASDTLYGGFSPKIGSDEIAWKASLEKLAALHFDLMSFGHCSPGLLSDVSNRIDCAKRSFANYYVPWFKDFVQSYAY